MASSFPKFHLGRSTALSGHTSSGSDQGASGPASASAQPIAGPSTSNRAGHFAKNIAIGRLVRSVLLHQSTANRTPQNSINERPPVLGNESANPSSSVWANEVKSALDAITGDPFPERTGLDNVFDLYPGRNDPVHSLQSAVESFHNQVQASSQQSGSPQESLAAVAPAQAAVASSSPGDPATAPRQISRPANDMPKPPQAVDSHAQTNTSPAQSSERRVRSRSPHPLQAKHMAQSEQASSNSNVSNAETGTASFPNTVEAWQAAIGAQKTRLIDKSSAAQVLNEIRFNPHAPGALAGNLPSHQELKSRITSDHVDRWNQALGLSAAQVKAMNDMAFWGGMTVPANNSFFNALSFALVPMLQYLSKDMKNPWAQAGVGLGIVAIQPMLSSVVQTYAVASLEVLRQKGAPSVQLEKGSINAKKTPRQLAGEIDAASEALRQSTAELNSLMLELARTHNIEVPEEGNQLDHTHLERILEQATPEQRNQLGALHQANASHLLQLGELVVSMQKADGGQDRAKHLNAWQILPRTLRGLSRLPAAFFNGYGKDYAQNLKAPLEPIEISGISIGVAMGCQLLQHLAAGVDEVAGQSHDHKMNMLYADVFNPTGKAAWEKGESAILPEHLDEEKLRRLVELPETQMAKRVAKLIEGRLKDARASLPPETAGQVITSPNDPEAGAVPARGTIQYRIAELADDLEQLRKGNLGGLSPTGEARKLVNGVMKRFAVGHAVTESHAKMTAMEFTAQLGQRIAQSFTFGVGGSAAAVTAGPVVTALLGGNDKVPNAAKIGISFANMAVAGFSAATQYMVVNVKNNRRDGGEMGFLNQVWQGVISPVIAAKDYLASGRGLETAEKTFNDHRNALSKSLDDLVAEAQNALPGAWKEDGDESSGSSRPDDTQIRKGPQTLATAMPGA